jgi:anhydro-N-acetylmuramic acid kinase
MNKISYTSIGLMSGTSGDGLDLAYCQYEFDGNWTFEITEALTIPFPADLAEMLMSSHLLSAQELALLDVSFGNWMGEQVHDFCAEKQIKPMAICSHGHTVFHQPSKGLSLQIGNGWSLQQSSGEVVINDFRMKDVQLGGQGAPLVPIGDHLLFSTIDFCINLGGIANISMSKEGSRIAFDTCPFNLLLNSQARKLGHPYDDGGKWASEGKLDMTLFKKFNSLPYYDKKGAKSLGREDIDQHFLPLIDKSNLSEKDILRTLVEHYAYQFSEVIKSYKNVNQPSVLITGGGAYHSFFIQRLDHHLQSNWQKVAANSKLIEFKEALVFGFLGVLKLRGENNCLASVTGASEDSCGGTLYS